jgi:hypothetical protein
VCAANKGGDPESIEFLETLELDYVSCSPARVPAARLAIAQTTIAAEADTSLPASIKVYTGGSEMSTISSLEL